MARRAGVRGVRAAAGLERGDEEGAGNAPIVVVARRGNGEVVSKLHELGADAGEAKRRGRAAAMEAAALGRADALERLLDAKLVPQFDALSEQPLQESQGSLAAVHDARLRQRIRLNSRIDQQLASLARTPSNEYDAFSAERAVMIVITPIPTRTIVD